MLVEGVIDTRHQLFGHPGLYVVDASAIPVNLGVNPSLTITALAERFASLIPPMDAADDPASASQGRRCRVCRGFPSSRFEARSYVWGSSDGRVVGP